LDSLGGSSRLWWLKKKKERGRPWRHTSGGETGNRILRWESRVTEKKKLMGVQLTPSWASWNGTEKGADEWAGGKRQLGFKLTDFTKGVRKEDRGGVARGKINLKRPRVGGKGKDKKKGVPRRFTTVQVRGGGTSLVPAQREKDSHARLRGRKTKRRVHRLEKIFNLSLGNG